MFVYSHIPYFPQMNRILVTTTSTIENYAITQYLGLVQANVVMGTGFFSDFAASITDLIGGNSRTYQRKLQEIYDQALDQIQEKTAMLGGNAVIGVHFDFDEISGKGVSMFMISATGTAVKVMIDKSSNLNDEGDTPLSIRDIALETEITKRSIIERLKSRQTEIDWDFLYKNPFDEAAEYLVKAIVENPEQGTLSDTENNTLMYLSLCSPSVVESVLYDHLEKCDRLLVFIERLNMFSPARVLSLINDPETRDIGIKCLNHHKESYDLSDLAVMKEILAVLDSLPDIGSIERVKGLISGEKERYICPAGHKNYSDTKYCCICGLDIKGHTAYQNSAINNFRNRVAVLDDMLKR